MSDVVMKEEVSNTLSNKELDAAVLPLDQPVNELTSPSYVDSNTLSVKELDSFLPRYKPSGHGYNPPPPQYAPTDFELYPHGPTTSVDHVGRWSPVVMHLPSTPPEEVKQHWKELLDTLLKRSVDDNVPRPDKPPPAMSSPDIFDSLPPSQIEYRRTFVPPFTPCPPYSPPPPGDYNYSRSQDAINAKPLLFAKIALHCYNLEKGTHFERLGLPRSYDQTLETRDRVSNYTCMFETNVRLVTENKDCFHAITTRCRPSPPPPGEDGFQCGFDTLSVDELFKGNMPEWLPDDYDATSSTLLMQYYEMKESEVEQAKEWLHLYAELALFNKIQRDPVVFDRSKPLELGKVVVQTRGAVKDVWLLDNAVFFITFKTSGGDVCKGIIRRTRDGIPEHLSLEAKCFM
ncbi:unnamed protein product [Eruca vesicaria subsp. sativa]|uniref:Uncharacterized protein n=1 Tax=Eruca vesicaria subsp. sativa TaxID=29727 RepID=A0ABC8JPP9_ERUVS|nr:unnamed protein product [Eruca vesicaria subsp. sativa]